jgi:hypothetical protein
MPGSLVTAPHWSGRREDGSRRDRFTRPRRDPARSGPRAGPRPSRW